MPATKQGAEVRRANAVLAALKCNGYPDDHPRVVEVREAFERGRAAEAAERYIDALVDLAPPLSEEQRARLRHLLNAS